MKILGYNLAEVTNAPFQIPSNVLYIILSLDAKQFKYLKRRKIAHKKYVDK
jgi:hypothetical protein